MEVETSIILIGTVNINEGGNQTKAKKFTQTALEAEA